MPDYLPLYLPGRAITSTTSANVVGGQPVYASGSGTVANTSSNTHIAIGVAGFDAPSGTQVEVYGRGTVHRLTTTGAVAANDLVEVAAGGTVTTHAVGTNDARVFGVALTSGASGAVVEIMEI